jgi:cyclic pyranopterin phosphate synthase
MNGVDNALSGDFDSVKINMVVQKGVNETEILPMARHFRGSGAILRFVEFMDVGNHNQWSPDQVFSAREVVDLIDGEFPLEPLDANYRGEVAKRWRYQDGEGEIGIISSITQPFCHGCARARLSATGELFTCLFATSGLDLRQVLQSGGREKVATVIASAWKGRNDRYSMERIEKGSTSAGGKGPKKVEMSYIGG